MNIQTHVIRGNAVSKSLHTDVVSLLEKCDLTAQFTYEETYQRIQSLVMRLSRRKNVGKIFFEVIETDRVRDIVIFLSSTSRWVQSNATHNSHSRLQELWNEWHQSLTDIHLSGNTHTQKKRSVHALKHKLTAQIASISHDFIYQGLASKYANERKMAVFLAQYMTIDVKFFKLLCANFRKETDLRVLNEYGKTFLACMRPVPKYVVRTLLRAPSVVAQEKGLYLLKSLPSSQRKEFKRSTERLSQYHIKILNQALKYIS